MIFKSQVLPLERRRDSLAIEIKVLRKIRRVKLKKIFNLLLDPPSCRLPLCKLRPAGWDVFRFTEYCVGAEARTRVIFSLSLRGDILDISNGIKRAFSPKRAMHFGGTRKGEVKRTRHSVDQLSPFSQPTGRECLPRFYGTKVVKPNGTRTRSAVPLYRCRCLSTSDSKSSFRLLPKNDAASLRKWD